MPIGNLFPNLVPCDSEFYFYPALNQRESICCQSGCHHVKCCVGRGAECPPAQIRPTEQTSSLTVPSTHPVMPLGLKGKRHRKAKRDLFSLKMEPGDAKGKRRLMYFIFKHGCVQLKSGSFLFFSSPLEQK